MHVLLVTPEVSPYIVVSQQADAISGLAQALYAEGATLTIVAPALKDALREQHALARRLHPLRFTLDDKPVEVGLLEGNLAGCGARVLLLDHERFAAISPHAAPTSDGTAFAVFARAALEVTVDLALGADLIHAHDWQSALVPLLAHRLTTRAEIRDLPVVFSAHHLDLPGHFHPDAISQASWFDEKNEVPWKMDGPSSLLYTGTVFADAVTTDSEDAADLLAERLSHSGLPTWIANRVARQPAVAPILPGLDYASWDSANSRHISAPYSADNRLHKAICKTDLLDRIGLTAKPEAPLLAAFSAHGADQLLAIVDQVVDAGVQMVVAGPASNGLSARIAEAREKHPSAVGRLPADLSEATIQRMLAAADAVFVLPSGGDIVTMVLKALRFGTVPITYATGSLGEMLVDYDPPSASGTALLMADTSTEATLHAIDRLCAAYQNERDWRDLQLSGMQQRFSWQQAAVQYVQVYRNLLAETPGEAVSRG